MELQALIIDDSRLIIKLESKTALIATGINYSLSNEKSIMILDKSFSMDNQYLGFTLEDIKKQLGIKIDCCIGSDILSKFNYSINFKTKEFLISTEEIHKGSNTLDLTIELNIPYISIVIGEKKILAVLDSLSKFSYLHERLILNKDHFQEKTDFFPNMGNFNVKTYDVTYTIDKDSLKLETGIYPPVITKSRFLSMDKGVLGIEFIKNYLITINSSSKKLNFDRL